MASVRSIEVSGIASESARAARQGGSVDAVARPDSTQESTGSSRRIAVPADGVVTLPQGTDLGSIVASGRDLIVPLPDGTRLVIVDGAVFVPELVIGSVEVPPATLIALLIGNETQTAAGPPSSSGGNFAVPVGGIGDGYALGDLLPPTALAFPAPTVEQLDVNIRVRDDDGPVDGIPTVTIVTPGNPAGSATATASVNEAGLPARGAESPGSNAAAPSETTTGTITYTPGDGPAVLTINGIAVTTAGQAITTPFGVLTITAVRADAADYSYTLTDNTSGDTTSDLFTVVVTDRDGDTANGTLTVSIIDDVPTAIADIDRVAVPTAPTAPTTVSVDFATGAFLAGAPAGATSVALNGAQLTAINGALSVFRGASVLSPSDGAPGQGWTFEIDSTNDQPEALRVDFTAAQSQVRLTLGQLYREAQLVPTPDAERVTVTVGLTDGTTVTRTVAATETSEPGEVFVTLSSADFGGRLITSVQLSPDPSPPTLPAGLSPADFAFYSTLVFSDFVLRGISYDLPGSPSTAPFADGNVLTGIGGTDANTTDGVADVRGADGATVTGVVAGVAASAAGNLGTALAGTYGTLTLAADGSYRYTPSATNAELRALVPGETRTDIFTYTITDGDGDTSTTTLTITLDGTDDPIAITNLNPAITGGDVIVLEANLPAGSAPSAGALTQAGDFTVVAPDGYGTITLGGQTIVSGGGFTPATITTPLGNTLTVTGFNAATGVVSYQYTLNGAANSGTSNRVTETFAVTATDRNGSTSSGSLVTTILDDSPTANADVDSVAVPTAPTAPTTVSVDFATGAFLAGAPAGATSVALNGAQLTAINGALSVFRGASVLSPSDGAPGQNYTLEIDATNDQLEALRVDFTAAQSQVRLTLGQLYREAQLVPTPDAERVTVTVGLADGTTVTCTVAATETSAPGEVFVTLSSADFGGRLITSVQLSPDPSPPTLPAGLSPADFAFYSTLVFSDFVLRGISYDLPGSPSTAPFADGNVLIGIGGTDANATDGVADVRGADGATVTGVAPGFAGVVTGNLGTGLAGAYGTLTLNADGSYRYTPSATNAELRALVPGETRQDIFTYTITDGDGDTATTTLTITLDGTDDPIAITNLTPAITGGDVIVQEASLATGTAPSAGALTQAGDFTIVAPDGYGTVTLGGQTIVSGGGFTPATITTPLGNTLTVTGFNAATGVISYQYTLNGASNAGTGESDRVTETFAVTATDRNGSTTTGSLVTTILDDTPVVNADVDSVTVGSPAGTTTTTTQVDYTDPAVLSGLAAGATQVTTAGVTLSSTNGALGYFRGASVLSANDGRPDQAWTAEVDSYNDQPEALRLSFAQAQSTVRITVGQLFQEQLFVPTPDPEKVTVTVQLVDGTTATRTITATATSGDGIASISLTAAEFGGRLIQSVVLAPDPSTPTLDPAVPVTPDVADNARSVYSDFVLRGVEYETTSPTPATRSFADGNVLTGIGGTDANTTDGVADRLGADGGQVTAVGANYDFGGTVGTPIAGIYGTLTLAANGAYSYVLNNDLPAVQGLPGGATLTDRFTYIVTDGDGDQAGTTLTITIQPPTASARLAVAAAPAATAAFGAPAFAALDRAAERAVEATTAAAITATLVTAAAVTATAATTAMASAETHATVDTHVAGGVTTEPGTAHVASSTVAESATVAATAAPTVDHHSAAAAEPQAIHADAAVSAMPIAAGDTAAHAAASSLADIPAPAPAIAFDTAAVAIAAAPAASATTPATDTQVATVVADVLHGGAPTDAPSVDQLLASLPDQHAAADQAAPALTLVADAGADHAALAAAWSAITAAFDSHAMASTGQDGVTAVAHAA